METIQATLLSMVVVHNEIADEVLLLNRPEEAGFPGYIGAGGKIEMTESFAEGAARELFEETGLVVNESNLIFKGVDEFIIQEDKYRYIVFNYLVKTYSGELLPDPPEGELEWVSRHKMMDLPMQSWFKRRLPKFFEDGTFEVSVEYEKDNHIPVKETIRNLK